MHSPSALSSFEMILFLRFQRICKVVLDTGKERNFFSLAIVASYITRIKYITHNILARC